jgi:CRP/FNR family cyclic AMP-dependent transcriptional regulator
VSVVTLHRPDCARSRPNAARQVAVTTLDPAFRAAIPADQMRLAQRFTADVHGLQRGVWAVHETDLRGRGAFAVLVLDGLLCQQVCLAGRPSAELLGPGDIIRPWQRADPAVPCDMQWTCVDTARVAVLDQRFVAAARRWPGLMAIVFERLNDQLQDAQRRTAITGLPRVEQRALALLWQLADRWGVVRPEGIVIPLRLTHEFLGHLIAAKRPTVTLAVAALAADGLVTRNGRGEWILAHDSADALPAGSDQVPSGGRERPAAAVAG